MEVSKLFERYLRGYEKKTKTKTKTNNCVKLNLPKEGGIEVSKFDEAKKNVSDCKSPTDLGNSERKFWCKDLRKR